MSGLLWTETGIKLLILLVSKKRTKLVYIRMSERLEYKGYKIKILCTDGFEGYASYKLAETSLVESKNSLIRHYLAMFNRQAKRYSKAFDMIFNSLLILFNKSLLFTSILVWQRLFCD
jgi:IS1 family transposase